MGEQDTQLVLSVVVPFYREGDLISGLLSSLEQQDADFPWELILVDNGNNQETQSAILPYLKRISHLRIIEAWDYSGPSHARNMGVRAAKSPLIAFCDADDELPENWIRSMREGIERHDFIACRIEEAKLNDPEITGIMHINPAGLMDYGYLPFSLGGSLGIKKSIFLHVGGFDRSLRFSEDSELCFRVQLAGTPLNYWSDTCLYYRLNTSTWKTCIQNLNWCRCGKAIGYKYKSYGHQEIGLSLKSVKTALKSGIIFILRFPDRRKRMIYARHLFQQIGFMLPLLKVAYEPIPKAEVLRSFLRNR